MEQVKYRQVNSDETKAEKQLEIPKGGKKQFNPNVEISEEDLRQCFDFAYEMAFGEGEHKRESFGDEGKKRNL